MRRFAGAVAVLAATCVTLFAAQPAYGTDPGKDGRIVFGADRGSGFEVYVDRPDGTGLTRLTNVSGNDNPTPDWSPDGTLIAFALVHREGCSIEVMDSDGSGLSDLTGDRKGCERYPAFTTSGKRLLFSLQRCGRCSVAIATMNLDGGDRRRIISGRHVPASAPVEPVAAAMAPDRRTVAFVANYDEGSATPFRKAVFTVRINGSHLTKIVPYWFNVSAKLDWSPNGERLLYTAYIDQPNGHASNIFTVRPDGSGVRQLTHASGDVSAISGTYSPNGRWILYRRETPTVRSKKSGLGTAPKVAARGKRPAQAVRARLSGSKRARAPRPLDVLQRGLPTLPAVEREIRSMSNHADVSAAPAASNSRRARSTAFGTLRAAHLTRLRSYAIAVWAGGVGGLAGPPSAAAGERDRSRGMRPDGVDDALGVSLRQMDGLGDESCRAWASCPRVASFFTPGPYASTVG
jgi:Tol biopolymer transport system component